MKKERCGGRGARAEGEGGGESQKKGGARRDSGTEIDRIGYIKGRGGKERKLNPLEERARGRQRRGGGRERRRTTDWKESVDG